VGNSLGKVLGFELGFSEMLGIALGTVLGLALGTKLMLGAKLGGSEMGQKSGKTPLSSSSSLQHPQFFTSFLLDLNDLPAGSTHSVWVPLPLPTCSRQMAIPSKVGVVVVVEVASPLV